MYTSARDYAPRLNAANVGVNPNINLDSLRYSTPPPNLGGTTPAPPYGQGTPHHLLGTGVGGIGVGVGAMNNVGGVGGGNMGGGGLGQFSVMGQQQQQQQQQAVMNMGAQQLALQMQQTMGNVGGIGNVGMGGGMGAPNANVGMGMGGSQGQMNQMGHEEAKIYQLVMDLMDPSRREGALLELSKKREQFDDLALVLWHSFGKF